MRLIALLALAATASAFAAGFPRPARAESAKRISGPFVHDNLAIYFVHGPSASGSAPLTLREALAKNTVRVTETGSVHELRIENLGDEEVFIQAGDIVKGGRQDRVLTISFVLAPKSGQVPIASYCVEQGRWRKRGAEDSTKFSSADYSLPSRAAKLAMKAPSAAAGSSGYANVGERQHKVWNDVSAVQTKLSKNLKGEVASPESKSSLQLSLENKKLEKTRDEYIKALKEKGEGPDDIVGFVFAVNGRINSADVYPSNGLFRKMWSKLLASSITEAIGEKPAEDNQGGLTPETPSSAAVEAFLNEAEKPKPQEHVMSDYAIRETRDAKDSLFVEAKRRKGGWIHRNYLAK
jgi:hypothetical protein